jgi:hypothetical protein
MNKRNPELAAYNEDVEELMRFIGVSRLVDLGNYFGVTKAAVSIWKSRGVPKHIQRRVERLRATSGVNGVAFREEILQEGLRLAIWLAPSVDSCGRRYKDDEFPQALQRYAQHFSQISFACAERIAACSVALNVDPPRAFEKLTRHGPEALLRLVLP